MNFKKLYSEFWKIGFKFRGFSQTSTKTENKMLDILRQEFPDATDLKVVDISGGCGAMFEIYVQSRRFDGMNRVKQHMTVNNALKNQIKDMHGLRIFTSTPAKEV